MTQDYFLAREADPPDPESFPVCKDRGVGRFGSKICGASFQSRNFADRLLPYRAGICCLSIAVVALCAADRTCRSPFWGSLSGTVSAHGL